MTFGFINILFLTVWLSSCLNPVRQKRLTTIFKCLATPVSLSVGLSSPVGSPNTIVGSKYLESVPSAQSEVPDVAPPVPVPPLLVKDVPADVK